MKSEHYDNNIKINPPGENEHSNINDMNPDLIYQFCLYYIDAITHIIWYCQKIWYTTMYLYQ